MNILSKHSAKILLLTMLLTGISTFRAKAQFNWYAQDSDLGSDFIKDVFFLDLNNGWAVGQNGKITHTTNGGANWNQLTSPVNENLTGVCMSSNTVGWIVGEDETLLKTTDGGITWFIPPQPGASPGDLYDVQFTDVNHGWILGFSDNFRTVDGGNTWISFNPTGGGILNDLHFLNETKGWVCGVGNYLAYTTDGGATWNPVITLGAGNIYAVYAHSGNEVMIAGAGGYIHKSFDGGINWTVINAGISSTILDIDFMTPEVGVAVGNDGTGLTTADGGDSWNTVSFTTTDLTSVDMVDNGIGWIGGYDGVIYKSTYGANDLSIYEYHGLDTVCANVTTQVLLTLYNAGPAPIEQADIVLMDGSVDFLTYHWTGYMAANTYLDVNLGMTSVTHSGAYTGVISGDSVTTNNTSTKFIQVVQNPVSTSLQSIICLGDSVQIGASGGNSYYWTNASADYSSAIQTIKPKQTQYYFVMVQTNYCEVKDSVRVVVNNCSNPITAISPNSDGKNDYLFIPDLTDSENRLQVYNSWGDLVNSITNYDNVSVIWDGKDSAGNQLIEGTYYYIFESFGSGKRFCSWVQILR